MENSKIYVILDIDKFNNFCEEKLGSDITADDFIYMESFRNEKVHLVPKYGATTNYYITGKSKYNILVNVRNEWEEKNIVSITDRDIERLLEDDIIQDEKEFKKWEKTFSYEVSNLVEFYKYVDGKFSDKEMLLLLSNNNRSNFDIYTVKIKNEYVIMYKDSKIDILRILPNARLTQKEILDLINNDVLISDKCKINYEDNSIKLDNKLFAISSMNKVFPRINMMLRPDGYYDVRIRANNTNPYKVSMVRAVGKTEQDALRSLKNKLLNSLNAPSVTMRAYQHLIEPKNLELD